MPNPDDLPADGPEVFHDLEPHPIAVQRERVLRQLLEGVAPGQIEDQLIAEGMAVEDAVTLVTSVSRTGYYDGKVSGYATYEGGRVVAFEEDHLSKRRRERAVRGQREVARVARGEPDDVPEAVFEGAPSLHAQRAALRQSQGGLVTVVVGALGLGLLLGVIAFLLG